MAHYLSEVTHLRLELRSEVNTAAPRGVTHTHDFTGQIRCAEVIPRVKRSDVEVWTGDANGTLTIRKGLDGMPVRGIAPVSPNIFIYALQFVFPHMWAGRSDGFLECFTTDNYVKTFETKAHVGSVTCLHHTSNVVLSGGTDWQIVAWDDTTCVRVFQFTGHVNSVRCFAGERSLVYSGGDDGVIYCWDVDTQAVKAPLWPIKAHGESVRSLAIHEVYLFSASNDGSIRVWNTQTAQLAKVLDTRNGAFTSLFVVPLTAKLWTSCSDGSVSIWDIATLSRESLLSENRTTSIPLVMGVARANSVKLWTYGTGGISVWFHDTDPDATSFEALSEMESDLQQPVDEYRQRIVHNYQQLERCKEDLQILERRDVRKKREAAKALEASSVRCRQLLVLERLKMHALKTNHNAFYRAVALVLEAEARRRVARPFFVLWLRFAQQRERTKLNAKLEATISHASKEQLTVRLLWQLAAQARGEHNRQQQQRLAAQLERRLSLSRARSRFRTWMFAAAASRVVGQQLRLLDAIDRADRETRARTLWTTICRGKALYQASRVAAAAAEVLRRSSQMLLAQERFLSWKRYVAHRQLRKRQCVVAAALLQRNRRDAYGIWFRRWALFPARLRLERESAAARAEVDVIATLQATVDRNASSTERSLEAELHEKQLLLARLMEECRDLDDEIQGVSRKKREVQRDLIRDTSVDATLPVPQQLHLSVEFLKARGVSAFHHVTHLIDAREELRKDGPDALMRDGVLTVRKVFAKYVKPERIKEPKDPQWFVGELFSKIKRKGVERASVGLCKIVCAFDSMTPQQVDAWTEPHPTDPMKRVWNKEHEFANEVTANLGPLLELALRAFRYRRGEHPVTGEPVVRVTKKTLRKTHDVPRAAASAAARTKQLMPRKRLRLKRKVGNAVLPASAQVAEEPPGAAAAVVPRQAADVDDTSPTQGAPATSNDNSAAVIHNGDALAETLLHASDDRVTSQSPEKSEAAVAQAKGNGDTYLTSGGDCESDVVVRPDSGEAANAVTGSPSNAPPPARPRLEEF